MPSPVECIETRGNEIWVWGISPLGARCLVGLYRQSFGVWVQLERRFGGGVPVWQSRGVLRLSRPFPFSTN